MSNCSQPAMVQFSNDTETVDKSGLKQRPKAAHMRSMSGSLEDDSLLLANVPSPPSSSQGFF